MDFLKHLILCWILWFKFIHFIGEKNSFLQVRADLNCLFDYVSNDQNMLIQILRQAKLEQIKMFSSMSMRLIDHDWQKPHNPSIAMLN